MSKTNEISLVDKVEGIITQRNELNQLIFNYITKNGLEGSFYKYLIAAEGSGDYRQLDIDHMMLDYMGSK